MLYLKLKGEGAACVMVLEANEKEILQFGSVRDFEEWTATLEDQEISFMCSSSLDWPIDEPDAPNPIVELCNYIRGNTIPLR